jgi:5-methylcytosine-specific restriction protein A
VPNRLQYSCRWPTCSERVSTSGYCPKHRAVMGGSGWAQRPTGRSEAYRGAWPAIRARVLAEEPRCRMCGQPATEVDHALPLAMGGSHDRSNLRALCHDDHKAVTAAIPRRRRTQ